MKPGTLTVVITVVLVLLAGGGYLFYGKPKLDEQRQALETEIAAQEKELAQIELYKVEKEELKKLLPRWKEQFEVFRAAIPVKMDDDVFMRNLSEQLRANGVRLMSMEIAPTGQWFSNINETQEANYRNENVKPEELRLVKVANFSMSLIGDFGDVLRAFENMKLYGRIYALDRITSPTGGQGGAVFINEDAGATPMQVSGRIFYGLSENYLSQDTLDRFFGRAEALGAASAIYESAINRADSISANPASVPQSPPAGSAPAAETSPAAEPTPEPAAADTSANAISSRQVAGNINGKPANRRAAVGG